ncbi:DNA mismatch repair endonuclease MutL [bacterium]|nr:DNA mismatch repair endonuclease MutL [bacterium]
MSKPVLNILSADVINKIAAGEVVERPASIVKELVDNSIDAKSSKITVKIKNGGIDEIEVSDKGIGIPKENLNNIFKAHTTSKIKDIEDLNSLISMGFRGEALSTITSVCKVTLSSKYVDEEIGNAISYGENGQSEITPCAKEDGTTVIVKDVFYNIPARRKYLKTPATEYNKIAQLMDRYFLMYPNISFVFVKDGKEIANLPIVSEEELITKERVEHVLGKEFASSMLPVFYDGNGIHIQGFIGHPTQHKSRCTDQYVFINKRGITDNGITKSFYSGYSRFIPNGEKVPFVLNITMRPDLVDVNVHPRKEEVRFENPFRVYMAVQNCVEHALEKGTSYKPSVSTNDVENVEVNKEQPVNSVEKGFSYDNLPVKKVDFSALRDRLNSSTYHSQDNYSKPSSINSSSSSKVINSYASTNNATVQQSLEFSKNLLTPLKENDNNDINIDNKEDNAITVEDISSSEWDDSHIISINQIFNKYILIEFAEQKLLVIDQHAAAERYNFERLQKREAGKSNLQNLLVPEKIEFTKAELSFLEENIDFFKELGLTYTVEDKCISITVIPAEFKVSELKNTFVEIFSLEDSPEALTKNIQEKKNDILATIACHGSIRKGQKLAKEEMLQVFKELKQCKNAYSCPHGRPIVWQLPLTEIDKHFERTY